MLTSLLQAEGHQGPISESVTKAACDLIEASWDVDRAAIDSFLLSLAAYVRERLEQVSALLRVLGIGAWGRFWWISSDVGNLLNSCTGEI